MVHQWWVEIPHAFSIPRIHCVEQKIAAAIFKILSECIFQNKVNFTSNQVKAIAVRIHQVAIHLRDISGEK